MYIRKNILDWTRANYEVWKDFNLDNELELRLLYQKAKDEGIVKVPFIIFNIRKYLLKIKREKKNLNKKIFYFRKDKFNRYNFFYGDQKLAIIEKFVSNNWCWAKEDSKGEPKEFSPLKSLKKCKSEVLTYFWDRSS